MAKGYQKMDMVQSTLSAESVLAWLLQAEEHDVKWVVRELSRKRGSFEAFQNTTETNKTIGIATRTSQQLSQDREDTIVATQDKILPSLLQFAAPLYFVEEYEGAIQLKVLRLGDKTGESVVNFKTEDSSAIAGEEYVAHSGKLVFNPGESQKYLTVKILASDLWKPASDFEVVLTNEELQGAILGRYLYRTRVRVIDETTFPTDAFQGVNWEEEDLKVSPQQLLWHYFLMTWSTPQIRRASIKWMIVDGFHVCIDAADLLLNVYLLDFILNEERPASELLFVHVRHEALILQALIKFVILLFRYWADYSRVSFRLVGLCHLQLKGGLLRKFLNYRADVHDKLHAGEIIVALEHDIERIVIDGYMNFIELVNLSQNVASKVLFMILCPRIVGQADVRLDSICCLLAVPIALTIFLYCRSRRVEEYLHRRHERDSELARTLVMTCTNSDLVFGYSLRNYVYGRFIEMLRGVVLACVHCAQIEMNNEYVATFATFLAVSTYTFISGFRILSGQLTFGMFVTNMRVFHELEGLFIAMYVTMQLMQSAAPSMLRIAKLLNSPTDLAQRKELARYRENVTEELRGYILKAGAVNALDKLPIKLDLGYYEFQGASIAKTLKFNGCIDVAQGQLMAVIGGKGCGKATVLHLITGTLLPNTRCKTFVPSHLRLVSVPEYPLFLPGTLFENLTIGITHAEDSCSNRVMHICKDFLKMEARALQYLTESHEHKWADIFSTAQCRLFMIARALIFNAEIICIHKPLNGLTRDEIDNVLQALKTHVERKGLLQLSEISTRRPRTLFFSSSSHDRKMLEAKTHCVIDVDDSSKFKL